ncbi:hypothetical protein [Okeania sp. SIO2B9]|nr:hypothetical protein [Okeania sp. SIO2B9]
MTQGGLTPHWKMLAKPVITLPPCPINNRPVPLGDLIEQLQ